MPAAAAADLPPNVDPIVTLTIILQHMYIPQAWALLIFVKSFNTHYQQKNGWSIAFSWFHNLVLQIIQSKNTTTWWLVEHEWSSPSHSRWWMFIIVCDSKNLKSKFVWLIKTTRMNFEKKYYLTAQTMGLASSGPFSLCPTSSSSDCSHSSSLYSQHG